MPLFCNVPNCGRTRSSRSHYCRHHKRRLSAYGHAQGKHIRPADLLFYAARVTRLLDANADHEGLRMAVAEIDRLLTDSLSSVFAGERVSQDIAHYARLKSAGVTPTHILAMVAAVALFDKQREGYLRNTATFHFAVARAVCGLAPLRRMPLGSRTLDTIGSLFTDRYGAIVGQAMRVVEQELESEQRRSLAMLVPLRPRG